MKNDRFRLFLNLEDKNVAAQVSPPFVFLNVAEGLVMAGIFQNFLDFALQAFLQFKIVFYLFNVLVEIDGRPRNVLTHSKSF